MQDRRAVCALRHQRAAAVAELEQAEVDQRQADAGDQTRHHGIARQQAGALNAARARRVDDNDTEHQRAKRIHSEIAIDEAAGEGGALIVFSSRRDGACRPDQRGDAEHRQRDDFQRREEVAHGVQQLAGIERNANHQREIDKAVDKQRQRAVAGQRRDAHLERYGRGARRGEQRADRQIADGGQQQSGALADRGAERVDAAADARQRDNGHHRQANGGDQETNGGRPDMFARLNTDHWWENNVTRANKQGKRHKAQREDILRG